MAHWGDRLKQAATQKGWGAAELARRAGLPAANVVKYLQCAVDNPRGNTMSRLAKALGCSEMWLRHGTGEMTAPDPLETNVRPGPELPGLDTPRNVEVLGVVAGGDDDWFDLNGSVIDYVRQPPGIAKADQVFALYVVGESMSPRYDPGDLVYINKSRPPAIGGDVVVELHPEGEGRPGRAFIKRLVRRNDSIVVLQQFNPPKTIGLPARQVKQVLRILTNAEIMGV